MAVKGETRTALNYALNRGFQIHPDAFTFLERINTDNLEKIIKGVVKEKTRQRLFQINRDDLETYLGIKENENIHVEYKVLSDPTPKVTSAEGIEGYNALFLDRFKKLKSIVSSRPEGKMLKSTNTVKNTKPDDAYVCGLVTHKEADRNVTKIVLEDPTGSFEGIVFDQELQKKAGVLFNDQFVMIRVGVGKRTGFVVRDLILPDIADQSTQKSESEVFAAFLSDLHIGSKYFMEKEFLEFVEWLSSPDPVASKVRFVLIAGDVIDGVGIYPNQDKELVFPTIEKQLERTLELLEKIPKNVKIFLMPGNHDPGRRALPQPAIPKKYNESLWEKENIIMVGNPALVSLNGVKILMFHGQSIDDIVKTTPGLSYDSPVDVMRYLLRVRHLSPIYGSQTPIAPETEDLLVIDDVPDIFHVGHVHRAQVDMYKGILLLNSGSWQKQTPFQASVGMVPNPGIAIMVNLKTFRVLQEDYSGSNNVL